MGPPYLEEPDGQFLVIDRPWPHIRRSNQTYADNINSWLRFVGRRPSWKGPDEDVLCDIIYTRKNASPMPLILSLIFMIWIG